MPHPFEAAMRDAQQSLNLSTGMVEADLPKLGAQVRAQDWRMANAGVDWGSVASRTAADGRNPASTARPQVFQESVAYGDTAAARSGMAMSVREGAYFAAGAGNGAVFQDSIAYANAGARRPQGSQHPWMARDHQLARAEVAHEFELPDLRAARSTPTSVPRGGSAGKSGDCACGGNCGGKSGGTCNGACQGKGGGGASCGCGNKSAAAHGASAGNPWPLDDARHNLVLLAQELLLLEGHLADPERRCPSCVTKHALTVRALADEGRRSDPQGAYASIWHTASLAQLAGIRAGSAGWGAEGNEKSAVDEDVARRASATGPELRALQKLLGSSAGGDDLLGHLPIPRAGCQPDIGQILAAILAYLILRLLGVGPSAASSAAFGGLCEPPPPPPPSPPDPPDSLELASEGGANGMTTDDGKDPYSIGHHLGTCPQKKFTGSKDSVCGPGVKWMSLLCKDLSGQKGALEYEIGWEGTKDSNGQDMWGTLVDIKCMK